MDGGSAETRRRLGLGSRVHHYSPKLVKNVVYGSMCHAELGSSSSTDNTDNTVQTRFCVEALIETSTPPVCSDGW